MRKKIQSRRGISLVMAMVFMLVSAAVGSIILAAASANAGHLRSDLADQKEYMAVKSAVNLVKSDFEQMTLTCSYKGTKTITREEKEDGSVIKKQTIYYQKEPTKLDENDDFPLDCSKILNHKIKFEYMRDLDGVYIKEYAKDGWSREASNFEAFSSVSLTDKRQFMLRIQPTSPENVQTGNIYGMKLPPVEALVTVYFDDPAHKPGSIDVTLYALRTPEDGVEEDLDYQSYVTTMSFLPDWQAPSGIKPSAPHNEGGKYVQEEVVGEIRELKWTLDKIKRGG